MHLSAMKRNFPRAGHGGPAAGAHRDVYAPFVRELDDHVLFGELSGDRQILQHHVDLNLSILRLVPCVPPELK